MINTSPGAWLRIFRFSLLRLLSRFIEVLNLLAHLLDQHFQFNGSAGRARVYRLRTECVGFAIELLHQKVEAASNWLFECQHASNFADVCISRSLLLPRQPSG